MREIADCVCEFVLAARRRLQLFDEFENAWPKCVETSVIKRNSVLGQLAPPLCFTWLWFFAKIDKLHLLVHKNGAALTDVFAARNRDYRFHIIRKIDYAFVIFLADQNVAVAQCKRRPASEVESKVDDAARAILHGLCRVFDRGVVTATIPKKIPHCFGMITDDNQKFAHSHIAQSLYNMLQDRLAPHFDHRIWNVISQLAHAGAASGCEYNCALDLGHLGSQFSAGSNGGTNSCEPGLAELPPSSHYPLFFR